MPARIAGGAEVGADPLFQVARFSHVEDASFVSPHQVNTRRSREVVGSGDIDHGYFLLKVHEITIGTQDYKVKAEDLKHIFRAEFKGVSIIIKRLAVQMGVKCCNDPEGPLNKPFIVDKPEL